LGLPTFEILAQPANDDFEGRIALSGSPVEVSGSNVGATLEANEPSFIRDAGGGSVWWSWTAPMPGRFDVTTAGSDFDTLLGVYTGEALTSLAPLSTNDDEDLLGGIFTSRLSFFARTGTAYQIVVAGNKTGVAEFASGTVRLQILSPPSRPVPEWEAADVDGQTVRSSAFSGRIVLLDFWATWCAPCRAEIPIFINLQNRYETNGFTIVGVSVDTAGLEVVRQFMAELGMNYPVVMTNPQLESNLGGIPSIPTAFLIDRRNNIVLRHVGFGDREFWEGEIESLMAGDTLPVSLGIKRVAGALGAITISWPSFSAGHVLKSTVRLDSTAWSPVSEAIEVRDGENFVVLRTDKSARFLRLRKQ
jgi:thiol-disulfide isomerase/thioredoxin